MSDGFLGASSQLAVTINDIDVPFQNIKEFVMRESMFSLGCELDMTFVDPGVFSEIVPICDTSIIKVSFSLDRDKLLTINFKIFAHESERTQLDGGIMYVWRVVSVQSTPGTTTGIQTRAFPTMTSKDVLETLAQEMGLTLTSDVKPQDSQTWLQINIGNYSFLRYVIKRAFVQQRDLPLAFVTKEAELKYTSLQTIVDKTETYTFINNDILTIDGQDWIINKLKESFNENIMFYRTGVMAKSFSTIKNYVGAYGRNFTYFDGTDLREVRLTFPTPSMTTNKDRSANKQALYDSQTYGLKYGNVHEKYMLATNQNRYISDAFFSSYINVVVNPNFDLKIGDKINMVYIKNVDKYFKGQPSIDEINSGYYIVGNILHNIVPNGTYTMIVTLFRDGLNLNDRVNEKLGLYE